MDFDPSITHAQTLDGAMKPEQRRPIDPTALDAVLAEHPGRRHHDGASWLTSGEGDPLCSVSSSSGSAVLSLSCGNHQYLTHLPTVLLLGLDLAVHLRANLLKEVVAGCATEAQPLSCWIRAVPTTTCSARRSTRCSSACTRPTRLAVEYIVDGADLVPEFCAFVVAAAPADLAPTLRELDVGAVEIRPVGPDQTVVMRTGRAQETGLELVVVTSGVGILEWRRLSRRPSEA